MNPDAIQMEIIRATHAQKSKVEQARRDALHRAAVARRRKAKRGGKR